MNTDIGTYAKHLQNTQFENGLLTYVNEGTFGDMNELIKDVGINNDTLEFYNVQDLQKQKERLQVFPSDHNFQYLMNALFTPLDMTDYEDNFVGFNEVGGALPISDA